jgi:predicted nucleic acid-binding protein
MSYSWRCSKALRTNGTRAGWKLKLRKLPIVAIVSDPLVVKAARHYRIMRSFGFTMSKAADLLIGTYCIEHSHDQLHNDSDFYAMEKYCGLRVL